MPFAKLSGALLVRKDAPIAETVSVPKAAPAAASAASEADKLLAHHLKALKLPAFLSEYEKLAGQYAAEGLDTFDYLLRLAELELMDREKRLVERRIRQARFPAAKNLDSFDFAAVPSLDKRLVMDLTRCDYITRRENVIIIGDNGTGKTHLSIGLITAASLMNELLEARDDRRLMRLKGRLAAYNLLIIDEFAYAPLSTGVGGLLFDVISQRHERGSTVITSNLPFDEWINVFGTARLTDVVLDRLAHQVHILYTQGDSYRIRQSNQSRHGNGARRGRQAG